MSFQRRVEPEWSSKNVHLFFINPVLFLPFFWFSVPVLLYKSQQRRVVVSCLTLPFKLSDTLKKKNLPPGIKLYWMLLPIRSGRLTIKIPDKGIKVYVRQCEHVIAVLSDTWSEICVGIFLQESRQHLVMLLQSCLQVKHILLLANTKGWTTSYYKLAENNLSQWSEVFCQPHGYFSLFRRQQY